MAIYTYFCEKCGTKVEKRVQKMDEIVLCQCGEKTKMVWSVPAVAQWNCSKGSL